VDQEQLSRWRPSKGQLLWTGAIVALLIIAILVGYKYGITLWDWIKLLVIPAVIAGVGIWFNNQQRERELEIASQQRERELELAQHQRAQELEIADQRRQDEALQAYLDQMSQLLLDKARPLRKAIITVRESEEGEDVRVVARARTLTILTRLDSVRKASVLHFLYESDLIAKGSLVISLSEADLSNADLSGFKLTLADLYVANLSYANLSYASLGYARLYRVKLVGTDLSHTSLEGADLQNADLSHANLSKSRLVRANLEGVDLKDANLEGADLRHATLNSRFRMSGIVQLSEARSLEGATMPNGQKFEEWLKDNSEDWRYVKEHPGVYEEDYGPSDEEIYGPS
jgi:uncharacterized protein YjbI with pentapeptide repeats